MIRILKVLLKKSRFSQYSNEYTAEIVEKGSVDVENIIDELLKDGLECRRDTALEIIERFHQRSIELVLSGYTVKTELVNLRPIIKGSVSSKKWNKSNNSVEVLLGAGCDLISALSESDFIIQDERDQPLEVFDDKDQILENAPTNCSDINGKSSRRNVDNLACGIAFREWLFKS